MDGIALRRNSHHFRPTPGDRTHVGFLLAILVDDKLFGGVDFGDRVGNFEVEDVGRALQAFGMFGALEYLARIRALALEHTASIVETMAQHMEVGLVPRHELSVVPNDAFEAVIGLSGHSYLHRRGGLAGRDDAFFMSTPTLYVSGQYPV